MSGGESFLFASDPSVMQKFKSQYSQYNDLRGSFGSQCFSSSALDSKATSSSSTGKPTYVLNLHLLGLSGLPKAGWFERAPGYELIIHAGGVAKRLRPRIPAPPQMAGAEIIDLEDFVPPEQMKVLQRLDDRSSIRCNAPGEFFRVDVWEERSPLLDFGNKSSREGHSRQMLGQCYVPLEHKYNRRPCTWPIVNRTDKAGLTEVGFLTCKFSLATMPGPVQSLRIVEGTVGCTEMQLAWEPPESDGGTVLRQYRVEARSVDSRDLRNNSPLAGIGPLGDETPRTASAPAVPEPSSVLKNLCGNTEYLFCVWAVSEAGPGTGAEVCGKTGAVAPGLCGWPQLGESDEGWIVQWLPPEDDGGADIVAYRVWLRALFHNSHGEVWPSEGWVDLGLSEHRGEQTATQAIPLRLESMPEPCEGCLCSLSALSTAGLMGPSTPEVPIIPPQSPPPLVSMQQQPQPVIESPAVLPIAVNGFTSTGAAAQQASPEVVADPLAQTVVHSGDPPSPDPLAQTVMHTGDPLAQYYSPGALARQDLRGLSDDAGAIADSRLQAAASSSTAQPQRREVRQAYAPSSGSPDSSSISSPGARSGSSPGVGAVVPDAASPERGRGYRAEASQVREQAILRGRVVDPSEILPAAYHPGGNAIEVQAVQVVQRERVVDPSEILPAAQTVRFRSEEVALAAPNAASQEGDSELGTTRPYEASYYRQAAAAALLKTEEVVRPFLQADVPRSVGQVAASRPARQAMDAQVPPEEAAPASLPQGGGLEAAGSWALGQKGSLSAAGRPSFELRSDPS